LLVTFANVLKLRGNTTMGADDIKPGSSRRVLEDKSEADARLKRLRKLADNAGGVPNLATRSGIPASTLYGHLQGQRMPIPDLIRIADACSVSIEWLAAGRGPMRRDQPQQVSEEELGAASPAIADIDMTILAGCLQLVEEVSEIGKERATAITRLRRAFGAYLEIMEEKTK
jgi:hypothetical protein